MIWKKGSVYIPWWKQKSPLFLFSKWVWPDFSSTPVTCRHSTHLFIMGIKCTAARTSASTKPRFSIVTSCDFRTGNLYGPHGWKQILKTHIQAYTHTEGGGRKSFYPLLIQWIRSSLIFIHDFISLCGCGAPMCFWQSYGGLAGPHSHSESVSSVSSVSSSPLAWWRRHPESAYLRRSKVYASPF